MRTALIVCLLLIASNGLKFLEEPTNLAEQDETLLSYATIFAQETPLFTEDEIKQNVEVAQDVELIDFDYNEENESTLESASDSQQQLIAQSYDSDLQAQGDCIILFSECDFKGSAQKLCNGVEQAYDFSLPIYSIYVPEGQQFAMVDQLEGNQMTFLMSENCLQQPIVMEDNQEDLQVSKDTQSWIGSDAQETEQQYEDAQVAQNMETQQDQQEIPQNEVNQSEPQEMIEDAEGNIISKDEYEQEVTQSDSTQEEEQQVIAAGQIATESGDNNNVEPLQGQEQAE